MILTMIWKDLTRALRDKKALITIILMPAVLTSILGFSIGKMMSSEINLDPISIAIVNQDENSNLEQDILSTFSSLGMNSAVDEDQINSMMEALSDFNPQEILFRDILNSDEVKKFISYSLVTFTEAQQLLDRDKVRAIVIIPEKFSYNTVINMTTPFFNPTEFRIIKKNADSIGAKITEEIFKGFSAHMSSIIIGKNVLLEVSAELGGDNSKVYNEIQTLSESVSKAAEQNFSVNYRSIDKMKTISGMQYYAVAMAMMFVLYTATFGARYIISEKTRYTYQRLIVADVSKWAVLMGRFVTTVLIAIIQIAALIAYSKLIFGIGWGNIADVAGLSLLVAIAIGSISVLLSAINLSLGDAKTSNLFEGIGIQFLSLTGGSFVPMDGAPIIKKIGSFTPNGAAMEGYFKIMQGYGLGDILPTITILATVSILLMLAGLLIMKREGEV